MIETTTVQKLNKLSKSKQIWCMGCGKRFYEMIAMYSNEPFVKRIVVLVDNNENLWGKQVNVAGREIVICGKNEFANIKNNAIVLITSDRAKEIYNGIEHLVGTKRVACYKYPQFYANLSLFLIGVCRLLPMRRQMLFYAGSEPHENADAIVYYLQENYNGKKYTIVYLGDDNKKNSADVVWLDKYSIRKSDATIKEIIKYIFYYSTSRFLLYENEALKKMRSKQTLIYLNHGTIPLKKVSDVLKQPEEVDYATCPGEGCAEFYSGQYGIPHDKHIYVMPARVNRMINGNGNMKQVIETCGRQTILWLPTFRQLEGSNRKDSACTNAVNLLVSNIECISNCLRQNNQILIIKKHPREKEDIMIDVCNDCIYVLSEEELLERGFSLQDILADTDALLTDYSGIAFEYLLLNRPIGYVVEDMNDYHRGFAVEEPYEYMPGQKIASVDDFVDFLNNVCMKKDEYTQARDALKNKLFGENAYKDGAEQLVHFLDSKI